MRALSLKFDAFGYPGADLIRFFEEKGRNPATRAGSPLRRYGARVNISATDRVVARVRGAT
jgi:hypothetical protein